MSLFHFSDDPNIKLFVPRPVLHPAPRSPGFEWLNGPLVWAIEEAFQALYLFPRECPRVLLWPTAATSDADRQAHWTAAPCRMIAYLERDWVDRWRHAILYRYRLPADGFENLGDVGMWVSRAAVRPIAVETLHDLADRLRQQQVELRIVDRLSALKYLWQTSLHASGIRLRNARGWSEEG